MTMTSGRMYRPVCPSLTQALVLVTHPKTTTNGGEAAAMLTAMSGLAWDQVEPGSEHPQQWELGVTDRGMRMVLALPFP